MYNFELKQSNAFHKKYRIDSFPVQLWQIEQTIIDRGYDIIISKKISSTSVMGRTVYLPVTCDSNARVYLSHELGHILNHSFNAYNAKNINISKCECQANAFAAYFLMPHIIFEGDAQTLNVWELSEKYGVPVEWVQKRFNLCQYGGLKNAQ